MIRALHTGLGIPAEVLLQEPGKELPDQQYDPGDYPFAEMYRQGYFSYFTGTLGEARIHAEELLEWLFSHFRQLYERQMFCRMSDREMDENALVAWQAKVLQVVQEMELPSFDRAQFTEAFLRSVIRLSYFDQGPLLAQELLRKKGIPLIILPHLSHTHLDGASMVNAEGRPIIGMTLRHDRLDNFWFTLAHELSHIYLHLDNHHLAFFDEINGEEDAEDHPEEREADEFARNLLIPEDVWQRQAGRMENASHEDVTQLAEQLQISPAIVAGRVRWETGDFKRFHSLVGNKKVKELFSSEEELA